MSSPTATLLVTCPDRRGLIALLSNFISTNNGDILHVDHHIDPVCQIFFTRLEWSLDGFRLGREAISREFGKLAADLDASWELHFSSDLPRLSIWAGKQEHCLLDLLWRHQSGELQADIVLIASNHRTLEAIASDFGVNFHYFPISKETKV